MVLIIIHVFQMDIICILMKYFFMFLIIIHVFQMDIICILMKCDSKHENNNSWHFMDIICILMKYYFNVFNHNSCILNGHYLHFNEKLF